MKQWIAFSHDYVMARVKCPVGDGLQTNYVRVTDSFLPSLDLLETIGVRSHRDGLALPPWAALLIVQVNGLIAKDRRKSKEDLYPQQVGTIALINIHHIHHCTYDHRNMTKGDRRFWAALRMRKDYLVEPSIKQVEDDFRAILR